MFADKYFSLFKHGLCPAWADSLEQACPVFLLSPGSVPALEPPANKIFKSLQLKAADFPIFRKYFYKAAFESCLEFGHLAAVLIIESAALIFCATYQNMLTWLLILSFLFFPLLKYCYNANNKQAQKLKLLPVLLGAGVKE